MSKKRHDGSDIWAGLSSAVERRKIQNRLNKRAERNRARHRSRETASVTSSSLASAHVPSADNRPISFQNGGLPPCLAIRPPTADLQTADTTARFALAAPSQSRRHKRWASKVYTGCITCRQLRSKCDEGQPICTQCTTSRRPCQGYSYPNTSNNLMQWPSPLLGICRDANPRDRELFFTMRTMALNTLAGSFDRTFWAIDVVRAAQTYPSVWHAGLAVTAMCSSLKHADMETGNSQQHLIYAMEQYGKSLRLIMAILGKPDISYTDKEAVLLSSILLIGFCCLQLDTPTALAQLGPSLQIFYHWRFWEMADPPPRSNIVNVCSLIRLFRRFESQFASSSAPKSWHTSKVQKMFIKRPVTSFKSIEDAYSELLPLQLVFSTEMVAPTIVEYYPAPDFLQRGRSLFENWKTRLHELLATQTFQASDEERILTVQILSISTEIRFRVSRVDGELAYDEWHAEFEKIVTLSERLFFVLTQNADATPRPFASRTLSFSASVCEALSFARHCRDGAIRRRVICLLRKWPHQDGLIFPQLIARIGEETLRLEEAPSLLQDALRPHTCRCVRHQYICAMHRVTDTIVRNKGGRVADLWLTRPIDRELQVVGAPLVTKMTFCW